MIIVDFIEKAKRLYPTKEAVVCGSTRLSYETFYTRCKKLACWFQRQGIQKGDVISVLHYNCHTCLETFFAAAFCGAILNPINVRLSPHEIQYILEDAASKLLITHERYASQLSAIKEYLKEILWTGGCVPDGFPGSTYEGALADTGTLNNFREVSVEEDDIAHLFYTSGTTGKAKGVPLTHRNVTIHALGLIAEFGISDGDNWLHAAPMFHLGDAWAVFAFTAVGAKHTLLNDFREKEFFRLIETEKITISFMVPTMYRMLLTSGDLSDYDFSSLRLLMSGAAPITPNLVRKIMSSFGCDYLQRYGMTETGQLTISKLKGNLEKLSPDEQLIYKAKAGKEFLGVQLRVVRENGSDIKPDGTEVGEIIAKGDCITKGYWNLPEETAQTIKDGWLYTGDMATMDEEGYVNIVGRKKDMIITGGENVYSTEVEYVLNEHPAVLETAVIGIPDEKWGEAVKAFVVVKDGRSTTEQEIISFVKERIARYKAPKIVEFIAHLPKSGSGKIMKQALKR